VRRKSAHLTSPTLQTYSTRQQGRIKLTRDPGKVVTARPHKRLAQPRGALVSTLQKHWSKSVKTDRIWQPTLQRQLGVTIYGGSHLVDLFKLKVISRKHDLFATVTPHNNLFVIDSLTIFTAQVVHSLLYWGKICLQSLADQNALYNSYTY